MGTCQSTDASEDTVPPSFTGPLSQRIRSEWEQRCRDMSYGTIATDLDDPPVIAGLGRRIRNVLYRQSAETIRLVINDDDPLCYAIVEFPPPYQLHAYAVELRFRNFRDLYRAFYHRIAILDDGNGKDRQEERSDRQEERSDRSDNDGNSKDRQEERSDNRRKHSDATVTIIVEYGTTRYIYYRNRQTGLLSRQHFITPSRTDLRSQGLHPSSPRNNRHNDRNDHDVNVTYDSLVDLLRDWPPLN
jgi:hypothetical protein